jgi:transcriptional regulator with XRE-family HTH domain
LPNYREIFGKRCNEEMRKQGFNQTTFAQALGITQSGVSPYLAGKIEPGLDLIIRWAEVLKCEPASLLTEKSISSMAAEKLGIISHILSADDTSLKTLLRVLGPYLSGDKKKSTASGS